MLALLLSTLVLAATPELDNTRAGQHDLRVKRQLSPWMDSLEDADRQAVSSVLAQTLADLSELPDSPQARLDELVVLAELRDEDLSGIGSAAAFARAFPETEVRERGREDLEPAQRCAAARVAAERATSHADTLMDIVRGMDVRPSRTSLQALRRTQRLAGVLSQELDGGEAGAVDTGALAASWALTAGTSLMIDALDEDLAPLRAPAQLAPELTGSLTAAARDAWACLEQDEDENEEAPLAFDEDVRR